MSETGAIPAVRLQLLGVELTLLGGVLFLGVPLAGLQRLLSWGFLVAGLVVVLFGTFR